MATRITSNKEFREACVSVYCLVTHIRPEVYGSQLLTSSQIGYNPNIMPVMECRQQSYLKLTPVNAASVIHALVTSPTPMHPRQPNSTMRTPVYLVDR